MSSQTTVHNSPTTKIQLEISKDRTIEGDLVSIPLSQLKLDPTNVRFKHVGREMTDKQIEEWLWSLSDTKSLLREIKYSNGLSEKPYVRQIADSQYLVIEGNRRTVCLRRIAQEIKSGKEKGIPLEKIDPVQCVVLPKDADESTIALFLARVHVSGKKDWDAINKGAHVYDLIRRYDYDYDEVAHAISIGKNTISQNVKAYDATLRYHQKYPKDSLWLRRFSHFLELYKRRGLKDWVADLNNLDLFMKWVYENKIPMAIQVRKLDKIIIDGKDAYKALQNGATIDEALDVLKKDEERQTLVGSIADNVDGQVKDLHELVHNFPRSKMLEVAKNKEKIEGFETLYKEFGRLIKDIKSLG